jgi:transposase-like protein
MAEPAAQREVHEVVCPHCKKAFRAEVMHGEAARYEGFKCPHCRLFVPVTRAAPKDAA